MPNPTTLKPVRRARTLKVGDRVRDNDPRRGGRVMLVGCWLFDGNVLLKSKTARPSIVHSRRIHLDGKPRRSGWSVVR